MAELTPEQQQELAALMRGVKRFALACAFGIAIALLGIFSPQTLEPANWWPESKEPVAVLPEVQDGIHLASGLVAEEGYELVALTCSGCHSTKLVTQNRATREGWKELIVWMQETQKLWDLGENEPPILDYLAKHYGPENKGRRENLENIEWYELE